MSDKHTTPGSSSSPKTDGVEPISAMPAASASTEPVKPGEPDAGSPAQQAGHTATANPASTPTTAAVPDEAQAAAQGDAQGGATSAATPDISPEAAAGSRRGGWDLRVPEALDSKESRLKLSVGVLALLLALQWWSSRTETSDLRRELAQRLQSGENLNTQTKLIANRVDDELKVLQGKVALLEAKQIESQGQQLALEQLYQDLAKNRDDWALAEIEQVLSTASQQLQLAGNIRGALIALQNADARLTRADRPQFIAIRRAIAKDMDNLKSLPSVDLTGISVRLDALVAEIDYMPLLADEKPAIATPQPKTRLSTNAQTAAPASDWRTLIKDRWISWSGDLWNEIRQLVRVRSVDTPDALLLSPDQSFFAKENLKLRLLNARLALLSRNDAAFRSDLVEADRALVRYFDTRAKQTQSARELIKQLQGSLLSIEMPTLSHSLAAVRQSRTRP